MIEWHKPNLWQFWKLELDRTRYSKQRNVGSCCSYVVSRPCRFVVFKSLPCQTPISLKWWVLFWSVFLEWKLTLETMLWLLGLVSGSEKARQLPIETKPSPFQWLWGSWGSSLSKAIKSNHLSQQPNCWTPNGDSTFFPHWSPIRQFKTLVWQSWNKKGDVFKKSFQSLCVFTSRTWTSCWILLCGKAPKWPLQVLLPKHSWVVGSKKLLEKCWDYRCSWARKCGTIAFLSLHYMQFVSSFVSSTSQKFKIKNE